MAQDDNLLRPAGAAKLIKVSEATIRRWVREQRINKYTDGRGRMWVDRREVERMDRPSPEPVQTAGVR